LESVAEVGVVHSQRTQDRFGSSHAPQDGYVTHFRGWELALFARHVQWDVLPPSQVHLEALRRYRAIVLPNAACLSDEEAAALRAYVAGGGILLGTFETGCYHADGTRRDGGALDEVFGIKDLRLGVRGPLPHAYTRLRRRDALTAGFEDTDVLTNEGLVRQVAARAGVQVHATLVPEIFPQPPDLSYPTLWDNDAPLLLTNAFGQGRAVYFANQIDRLNVTSGHPDHQRLLENALAWALGDEPPLVTLEAERPDDAADVHVTVLRQRRTGNVYVHLVNYSGARGRPVRTPHHLGPITLTLQVPGFARSETAHLLMSGQPIGVQANQGRLTLTVPDLDLYEVVRLVG
jgi:hypothetical protein